MWSFIRIILLFLAASYIVAAEVAFTAQMVNPDGTIVQLDPDRHFSPATFHDSRSRQNHHPHHPQPDQLSGSKDGIQYSSNWCGAVAIANHTDIISHVVGDFYVPSLFGNDTRSFPQYAATWIGLDGYAPCTSAFLHAGVWSRVCNDSSISTSVIY